MLDGSMLAFLAISAVVIATPGQDTAVTVRNSLRAGRMGGVATALGICAGLMVWALAASLGVVGLLSASETLFTAIKLAGAAFLIYLGATALYRAWRNTPGLYKVDATSETIDRPARGFLQGLASNLGNPKIAVFFASLLPQFVPPGDGAATTSILLGLLFCTLTFFWLSGFALFVGTASDFMRRPRVQRALEGIAGVALISLGLRIAVDEA